MLKELVVLSLFVFLLSTVESNKPIKKVLSIVKDIKNEMVTVDEIVDALTPIIKGSCSCCDDKPKCQAILIVSGLPDPTANKSVQALDQDGHYLCDLPDIPIPYGRFGATMDGNILCGGYYYPNSKSCICYDMGSWFDYPDSLNEERWYASSWGRPYPNSYIEESHIYGGYYSPNTTEIAMCGDSTPSYNYNDGQFNTARCSIKFDDYVVITGGWDESTPGSVSATVAAYNDDGFLYYLPPLVEERAFHGCGHYIDNDGNMVYLVTGGIINSTIATKTTELSINEGAWFTVSPLPTPRIGLKCVSLNNKVICTGGWEFGTTFDVLGEVLQWDIYSNEWILISSIMPRVHHTASVLPCDEVKNYCIYQKKSFPKTESVDIQNVDGSN